MQQTIHETGFYKGTGSLVKVIEVRTSYKLHDDDTETMPLVTWVVVAHGVNGNIHEVHEYDKPVKAQRKFDRLTQ